MDDAGALIRAQIEALNVELWYRVDHQNGVGVAELFCEDGVYSVPGGRNAGRAAIDASYVARAARGPWVSRHVHSNLRLTIESPTRAHGVSILTLWARDGEAPLALVLPVSVSDVARHVRPRRRRRMAHPAPPPHGGVRRRRTRRPAVRR